MKTLTFAQTLHPENAEEQINPQNGGSTLWGTVMNEVRGDLPVVAIAEEVKDDLDGLEQHQHEEMEAGQVLATTSQPEPANEQNEVPARKPLGRGCFYLEGLIGCTMTFAAVAATFTVELAAAIIYCVAAMFHVTANTGEMAIFFRAVFLLVVNSLMICDAVLLTTSVMVTEILGWTTGLLTSIFSTGCCQTGEAWHMYIRKVCHLTRWAFRGFHDSWTLERVYPLEAGQRDEEGKTEIPPTLLPAQSVVVGHATIVPDTGAVVVSDEHHHNMGPFYNGQKKAPQ